MLLLCWRVTKIAYPRNRLQRKLPPRPTDIQARGFSSVHVDDDENTISCRWWRHVSRCKCRYFRGFAVKLVTIISLRNLLGPLQLPHSTHDIPRIYTVWKSDSVNPTQFLRVGRMRVTSQLGNARGGKFYVVHATTPTHKFHFTTHIPRKSFALSRIGSELLDNKINSPRLRIQLGLSQGLEGVWWSWELQGRPGPSRDLFLDSGPVGRFYLYN